MPGVLDAAIYMGLRGQIDHLIESARKNGVHCIGVCHISTHKRVAQVFRKIS
jgi:hypothetical protein